jgi:hypothetical protein
LLPNPSQLAALHGYAEKFKAAVCAADSSTEWAWFKTGVRHGLFSREATMIRRWMAIAVCGLGLVLPARTLAQLPPGAPPGYMPLPSGNGPVSPGMPMPGPVGNGMGPGAPLPDPGDDNPLSLSANRGPNAFEGGPGIPCHAPYASIGTQAFWRRNNASSSIGVVDAGTPAVMEQTVTVPMTLKLSTGQIVTVPGTVIANVTQPTFFDTGNLPLPGAPSFGDYSEQTGGLSWGVTGTFGYRFSDAAVEFDGFFIPNNGTKSVLIMSNQVGTPGPITVNRIDSVFPPVGTLVPGGINNQDISNAVASAYTGAQLSSRLDVPFFNAPSGFEGDKGLWLQADRVITTFSSTLGNMEFNYRYWPSEQISLIAGLRYVLEREDFSVATQDDRQVTDGTTDAQYRITTHNQILVGQIGVDGFLPIGPCMGLGGFFKAGWGNNWEAIDFSLTRGDGLVGFADRTRHEVFSQVYETGIYLDLAIFERCRLHAGYNLFWVVNVAEAVPNINYDLSLPAGHPNFHSSLFYHGPVLQAEFIF